uniref:Uncharacterized protein n=1 Tax=Anopheles maculatus TaxID=74869 RepID=A0A182T8W1_9DIPT
MFRPPVLALPNTHPTIAILPYLRHTIHADSAGVVAVGSHSHPTTDTHGPGQLASRSNRILDHLHHQHHSLGLVRTSPHLDVTDERHCELTQQPIYHHQHHHHNHHHHHPHPHHHSIPAAGPPILQSVNAQVVASDAILLPPHRQHSLLTSVDPQAPYLSRGLFVDRYLNVPFLTGAEHRLTAGSIGATVGGSVNGLH